MDKYEITSDIIYDEIRELLSMYDIPGITSSECTMIANKILRALYDAGYNLERYKTFI